MALAQVLVGQFRRFGFAAFGVCTVLTIKNARAWRAAAVPVKNLRQGFQQKQKRLIAKHVHRLCRSGSPDKIGRWLCGVHSASTMPFGGSRGGGPGPGGKMPQALVAVAIQQGVVQIEYGQSHVLPR